MKWFEKHPPQKERDLEIQWEEYLRGKLRPNEAVALKNEISNSGRGEEFELQAEMSRNVQEYLDRPEIPHGLVAHYEQLADEERQLRKLHGRRMLWQGFAGALAASLAVFLVLAGVNTWIHRPDSSELVADTTRSLWNRFMMDGFKAPDKGMTIDQVLARFEKELHIKPELPLSGGGVELVYGRVSETEEGKVANILLRKGGKRILLSVYKASDNPKWEDLPDGQWIIDADEYPRAVVWRRRDLIYSLAGYAKIKTFKEITQEIDPEILESH